MVIGSEANQIPLNSYLNELAFIHLRKPDFIKGSITKLQDTPGNLGLNSTTGNLSSGANGVITIEHSGIYVIGFNMFGHISAGGFPPFYTAFISIAGRSINLGGGGSSVFSASHFARYYLEKGSAVSAILSGNFTSLTVDGFLSLHEIYTGEI